MCRALLLVSKVRILMRAEMFSSCVCSMCRAGSGLWDGLITRPEESYRLCVCLCLTVCDLKTSTMRRPRARVGILSLRNKRGHTYR